MRRDGNEYERRERRKAQAEHKISTLESGRYREFVITRIRDAYQDVESASFQQFIEQGDFTQLPENMRHREVAFSRKVLAAFDAWNAQDDVLVLWDIDDTLGKAVRSGESDTFTPRPSLERLFPFIEQHFPDIQNGILSDRRDWNHPSNAEVLDILGNFINLDHLYSTPRPHESAGGYYYDDVKAALSAYTKAQMRLEELIGKPADPKDSILGSLASQQMGAILKWMRYMEVSQQTGMNVKVIDDYDLPLNVGENGVYIGTAERFRLDR